MRALLAAFAIFIGTLGIGCRSHPPRVNPRQIVGTWHYWPSSGCESTELINYELDFAPDGTYKQITKLKIGTTIRSDPNSWKLVSADTIHLDGWRNVFDHDGTMKQVPADLVVDVRRPPVLGVRPLTGCYYSQPK